MIRLVCYFILASVALACSSGDQDTYHLVYAQDGDSGVFCCDRGGNFSVRLLDIDAPEKGQPYYQQSKQQLEDYIDDKSLKLIGLDKDRFGRRLAVIEVNGVNINDKMVSSGSAWVWRFSTNKEIRELQQQARAAERGLWALPEAERQDPWLWRKSHPRK